MTVTIAKSREKYSNRTRKIVGLVINLNMRWVILRLYYQGGFVSPARQYILIYIFVAFGDAGSRFSTFSNPEGAGTGTGGWEHELAVVCNSRSENTSIMTRILGI